jgi:threonine synthase
LLARLEGVWTAPEAAATVAALSIMTRAGRVPATARVVLVLTGAGIKNDPPALPHPGELTGGEDAVVDAVVRALGR